MSATIAATPVRPDAATLYRDTEQLIWFTINRYKSSFGGDADEMFSEAQIIWMQCWEAFDPDKGAFSTLLVTSLQRRFQGMRNFMRRRSAVWATSLDAPRSEDWSLADLATYVDADFRVDEYLEELSNDAEVAVKLVLQAPADLANIAMGKGGHGHNWRSTLRRHLIDMGWSASRVADAFQEIAEKLCS